MNNETKVLLVEDETTLAVIIRDTLKSQGFQVTTANNGEQGLQLFFREHPFGMLELIVRIKALVGRAFISSQISHEEEPTKYVIGDYLLDTMKEHLVYAADNAPTELLSLSHRESEILRLLCRNKGEVVNNRDILLDLWGDDSYFNTRSLHVFITKLRHKLSRDPSVRIINVRGIGYKLI